MISVIIPAHNEEKVVAATLNELLDGVVSGELEIIVVCNGCSDNTAEVVASFGTGIICIETPVPSKANALNIGDTVARGFPRIYQDADVVLSLEAVRQIARVLQSGRFLAAAPRMQVDFRKASWPVRAYYEIWQRLPYVREGMIGTGVYAVSRDGRKRFSEFPLIISDDGYIRALFQAHERTSVETCHSLVRAPVALEGLMKIKIRSRLGGYELWQKFPELRKNERRSYSKALFELVSNLHLWPKILVYLFVNLQARFMAKKYAHTHGFTGWARDDSSREEAGGHDRGAI